MRKSNKIKAIGSIFLLTALLMAGCSGDEEKGQFSALKETVDTVAARVAENIIDATFATATSQDNFVEIANDINKTNPGIKDIIVNNSVLYAAGSDGITVRDFVNESVELIAPGKKFNALAFHNGNLYAGGDGLYIVRDNGVEPVEFDHEGEITSLLSDSVRLLVGTKDGLIARGLEDECLLDQVAVNCLAFDNDGLWVGTDGQGLFRWDGDRFLKRYLTRDTTIFDYVYDIDFNHDHLYVGASTGLFIYDGGRWDQWTTEMGLPSDKVNSIDASDWMVYVGTDAGVVSYFNRNIFPVRKFEQTPANVVQRMDNKLIAADENGGLFIKRGYSVKTLIEPMPIEKEEMEVFTQADENI